MSDQSTGYMYYMNTSQESMTDLEFGECLGSGKFGNVYRVSARTSSDEANPTNMLAKVIKLDPLIDLTKLSLYFQLDEVLNELTFLRELQNDYIVSIVDIICVLDFRDVNCLNSMVTILMNECEGTLNNLLESIAPEHLSESHCQNLCNDVCKALTYLHEHKVAHLGLKPSNIICKGSSSEGTPTEELIKNMTFKLTDTNHYQCFGPQHHGSRVFSQDSQFYAAPELLEPGNQLIDMEKCDVFSLGLTLAACLCPRTPDGDNTRLNALTGVTDFIESVANNVWREKYSEIRPEMINVIKSMVCRPNRRHTVEMVIQDPWLMTDDSDDESFGVGSDDGSEAGFDSDSDLGAVGGAVGGYDYD